MPSHAPLRAQRPLPSEAAFFNTIDPLRTLRQRCRLRYNLCMNGSGKWETVHTVEDFFDRPRSGFADYDGRPHAYECEWDEAADDWCSTYLLSPVTDQQLTWAKESYGIFERWLAAYHGGSLTDRDNHPALHSDRSRRDELEPLVKQALAMDRDHAVRVTAEFRGDFAPLNLQVRWRLD